ncbi:MAG: hypothetical protein IPI62_14580 [Bacteroidetes bacterium]|nr:hypothetical protein [Bacteroidota bacterium]
MEVYFGTNPSSLPYSRLTTDNHGNIYGAVVLQNGLDVLKIENLILQELSLRAQAFNPRHTYL